MALVKNWFDTFDFYDWAKDKSNIMQHLNSRYKDLLFSSLLNKSRGFPVDGEVVICFCQDKSKIGSKIWIKTKAYLVFSSTILTDITLLVNWFSNNINDAPKSSATNGHLTINQTQCTGWSIEGVCRESKPIMTTTEILDQPHTN